MGEGADLGGYRLTAADHMIHTVYGYYLHCNYGTHLDGGMSNNVVWQLR